jgi:hypothetical protein
METTPDVVGKFVCDMPVFGFIKKSSTYSYGLAVTSTFFWYYIGSAIYLLVKAKGGSGAALGTTAAIYVGITLAQVGALYVQTFYKKCNITMFGMLISIFVGMVVGLIIFGLIAGVAPNYLPLVPSSVESFTSLSLNGGLGNAPPASLVKDSASSAPTSSNVEKSGKPDDNDDFVCDLYKNGQLITSTISE